MNICREVIDEYTANVKLISDKILKAMANALHLDENSFLEQYGEQVQLDARFNFYPRCQNPDLVLGVKPHADGSAITILLPDKEVEGLQFLKDNEWFNAPIVPDALLVNVGDQAEVIITIKLVIKSLSNMLVGDYKIMLNVV